MSIPQFQTLSMPIATLASAGTCDLSSKEANVIHISGTTTITSFGTGANLRKVVVFLGALTLTHNATTLILRGGVNRTTAAGDVATFQSDASGNWRCEKYEPAAKTHLLFAGTTTEAPFKFQSGTHLTTPEAGALEYNGDLIFLTDGAGNRAGIAAEQWGRQGSNYTLTSTTSLQKLFNWSTNGTLTLGEGIYFFEMLLYLTSMSSTSGNGQIDLLGAGTATMGSVLYLASGMDDSTPTTTAVALSGSLATAAAGTASVVVAAAGTQMGTILRGAFRLSVGGTIIPSIALVTAAAASVRQNSYFICRRVGGNGLNYSGNWS